MKHCVLVSYITAYGQPKTHVLTAFLDETESLQRSVIQTLLWCNKESKTSEIFDFDINDIVQPLARPPLMEPTLNGAFSVEILPIYEMSRDR
jgi:hypothetical protein